MIIYIDIQMQIWFHTFIAWSATPIKVLPVLIIGVLAFVFLTSYKVTTFKVIVPSLCTVGKTLSMGLIFCRSHILGSTHLQTNYWFHWSLIWYKHSLWDSLCLVNIWSCSVETLWFSGLWLFEQSPCICAFADKMLRGLISYMCVC